MALQWLLNNLPSWSQTAIKKAPPQPSRSHQVQPAHVEFHSDPLTRVKKGRVAKSPSPVKNAVKQNRRSLGSVTPPINIYKIPRYQEEQSELSSASVVTTPSGSESSLDSEERYQPKHKIKENILEFDFEREASIQRQQLLIKQHSGLTDLEVKLFNQISVVGLEPLLPLSWQHDFPTFPDPMFVNTADPEAPMPFVCESRGSEYAGKLTWRLDNLSPFLP